MNESEIKWLREYVDVRFKGSDSLRQQERESDRLALLAARAEIERRLETMNEFRQQISTERQSFIGRIEFKAMEDRLWVIEKWQAKVVGALLLIGALGLTNFVRSWLIH